MEATKQAENAAKQAENAAKQAENAAKQAESTTKSWTEAQTKIFDKWFEAFKDAAAPKSNQGFEQIRKMTFDSSEESMRNALRAQAELGRITVETLAAFVPSAGQGSDGAAIKQLKGMVDSWTDAQAQVWSSWFEVAKKVDTSLWTESWDKFTDTVQQSVKRAGETPAQWFTRQEGGSNGPSTAKPAR